MRTEIARTFMPTFYPQLVDAPSTFDRDNVRGMATNVAWINHRVWETSHKAAETTSHSNEHEAAWIVAHCRYLLQNGYLGSSITVLCAYAEQFFVVHKQLQTISASMHEAKNILVRVLDNYQGEENDIVLVSFVRSNDKKKYRLFKGM